MNKAGNKVVDIILPWRIGDAVLNIPMLICLKQLIAKYGSESSYIILTQPFLNKLFKPLNIFECKSMAFKSKIKSFVKPADIVFFTETTNKNFGYCGKIKYGQTNTFKKTIKFDIEMPYMQINKLNEFLPEDLVLFLKNDYNLSLYSITLFGILLDLGYTSEQIIDTFVLNDNTLDLTNFRGFNHPCNGDKYIVFCMEAAYGRKGDAFRRWNEKNYIETAQKCYKDFGLKSVFVGVDKSFELPNETNFIDLRSQLNLFELAKVLRSSVCYLGNDSGPLHIANIMQKKSVGLYFRKETLLEFSPVFSELNKQLFAPESVDVFYDAFLEIYKH